MANRLSASSESDYKIVHDTIHGTIKIPQPYLALLETPEIQRLNCIHQLGLAYLVFPGANHTRLEHSLGTYHVAKRMAIALNLDETEITTVAVAGLLHDLGHGPFSHALEFIINNRLGLSHTDLTRDIILGDYNILDRSKSQLLQPIKPVHEILDEHDLDKELITKLICNEQIDFDPGLSINEELPVFENQQIFNNQRYLFQIIHSSIDADQIDYLLRDSHYTGVAHGVLDLARLIQTIQIFNNDLVVNKHGLSAVEGMLVARALMYSSVYFHKTVRIAELMLCRALERLENDQLQEFITISEGELIVELMKLEGLPQELITMLMFRKLFKRVFSIKASELEDDDKDLIRKLEDPLKRPQIEDEIAHRAGIPEGHVIIDVPAKELRFSEPRVHQTDIMILDQNVKPLNRYTPLARALQLKDIPEWAIMVATDQKYKEQVAKAVKKVLFG